MDAPADAGLAKENAVSQNLVSLDYTDEQIAAAMGGLQQIEAALPGLIAMQL